MDITSTSIQSALSSIRSTSERTNQVTGRLSSGSLSPKPSDDPVLWGEVEKLKTSASRLQSFSDNLNRAASSTRIAQASMTASRAQLLGMRESLTTALNQPEGSDSRQKTLVQYNQLHRLADDYSRPDDLNARKLLDDPARFTAAGDLEVAAGENNFKIKLSHQPIHLGAGGLDVPEAGSAQPSDTGSGPIITDITNATDEEIIVMVDLISTALERLQERSTGLSTDIAGVERQETLGQSARARLNSVADSINAPDLTAEAALAQSLTLRSNLAFSGLSSMNETRSLIIKLLG